MSLPNGKVGFNLDDLKAHLSCPPVDGLQDLELREALDRQ